MVVTKRRKKVKAKLKALFVPSLNPVLPVLEQKLRRTRQKRNLSLRAHWQVGHRLAMSPEVHRVVA
tara:strand:- start:66 stop:263 length:198 start_codon:yes stop_codon:yes gene_type:complete